MKLCFFLQESKGVPLGYHFSLYSYGPFDSDVLADIATAERLNVLKSGVVYYPSGTGYEYSLGSGSGNLDALASDFLDQNRSSIQWVLENFGGKTAGELELLSTILFVAKFHNPRDAAQLVNQVQLIKPHFSHDQIQKGFENLVSTGVLLREPAAGEIPGRGIN